MSLCCLRLILILLLGVPFAAQSDTLYRWVDEEGRAQFGDSPPPDDARQAEQLHMPTFTGSSTSAKDDPYSILNQVERLETWRQDRARELSERRRENREYELRLRELEARERASQVPPDRPVYGFGRPVYPRPPIHHPGVPDHRPRPPDFWKPDHPIYRPPVYPHPPIAVPYRGHSGAAIIVPR